MLHIVNKSPFETTSLASCLRVALPGSALLLIEDAVYAAAGATPLAAALVDRGLDVYVLGPDLEARGMREAVSERVRLVDYGGFVDLVAAHPRVQSWL